MEILDVTNWDRDDESNASGSRKKYWLIKPGTQKKFLFKFPQKNTGEAWAEVVAAKIGQMMELDVHKISFACIEGELGVLSENFCEDDEEFYAGRDLFFSISPDFEHLLLEQQIELLFRVLTECNITTDFICVLIFDALIANQDRHYENWGILRSNDGSIRLAPVYDNGSSLGYGLPTDKVVKILQNEEMFKAFTRRSQSILGLSGQYRPKTLDVLPVLKVRFPQECKGAIDRLERINQPKLEQILQTIPESIMPDTYKVWVERLVLYRKEWLQNWYYEK